MHVLRVRHIAIAAAVSTSVLSAGLPAQPPPQVTPPAGQPPQQGAQQAQSQQSRQQQAAQAEQNLLALQTQIMNQRRDPSKPGYQAIDSVLF